MRFIFLIYFSIWNLFGLLTIHNGQIKNIRYEINDQQITVSAELTAINEKDLRKMLNVNQEVVFYYYIEICKEKKGWFDELVSKDCFQKKVVFKQITNQYIGFSNYRTGKVLKERKLFTSFGDVFTWLTAINAAIKIDRNILKDSGVFYIRIRVRLARKHYFIILPIDVYTQWKRIWINRK